MDTHFDPNTYHPTFGTESNQEYNLFDDVLLTTRSFFHQMSHEYSLPDDVVEKAVHDACDFLHLNDMEIQSSRMTGLYPNDPTTLDDDILGFNRQQMLNMGVHDEKTLSLICTHEAAHRLLQNLASTHYLTNWQTELTCDAFIGARAAVEGLSLDRVESTLKEGKASVLYPDGDLRLRYLEIGRQIGEYLKNHDIPITAESIMVRLEQQLDTDSKMILHQEVIVNEEIAKQKGSTDHDRGVQNGYTREEINRKISKAKLDMAREEANMRHWKNMTNSKFEMGEPNSVEASAYKSAHDRYIKARDDVWKWEHTHAEEQRGFVELDEKSVDKDTFVGYSVDDYVKSCEKNMSDAEADMKKWEEKGLKDSGAYKTAEKKYNQAKTARDTALSNQKSQNTINKAVNAEETKSNLEAIRSINN